jgi:mono/diheme cytochrome c family protein
MRALLVVSSCLALGGCYDASMTKQRKYSAYAPSSLWSDGTSARAPPAGTVALGDLALDREANDPPPATPALLARGRQRYAIFCAPCHGDDGRGDGIVVKRGFPKPPPFDLSRLREASGRRLFDVITHGVGVMYPYASMIAPTDRWAIVAYIRAIQLAEGASVRPPSSPAGPLE